MSVICLRNGRLMQVFSKNQSKKLTLTCLSDLCPNYMMVWYSGEGLVSKMFRGKNKRLINKSALSV